MTFLIYSLTAARLLQKAVIDFSCNKSGDQDGGITVKIPKGLPDPYLEKMIEDPVRAEELK
jgi:hypothetical protein